MDFLSSIVKKREAMLDELIAVLPQLKTEFGLHGSTSGDEWKAISLIYRDIAQMVESFENFAGCLDFDDLDSWVKQVKAEVDEHRNITRQAAELGMDLGTLSLRDLDTLSEAEILEKAAGNIPGYKMMQSLFGPNWISYQDAICDLSGIIAMPSEYRLPRDTIMPNIVTVANEIVALWKTLSQLESEGRVGSFKVRWDQLHLEGRNAWLQQFSQLHRRPDMAICALAQNLEKSLSRQLFSSPLLNIEDLAQANVLPDFLHTRSAIHPKTFFSADSRFVALGYWHNMFPKMRSVGRISFSPDTTVNAEDCAYGIQFKSDTMKNLHLINPAIGYHSLRAQQKTYEFLVSCLSTQIELSIEPTASMGRVNQSQPLALLNLTSQLHYGRPDDVRWENLTDMSKASADEALDDLWQLRHDAEYWNMRFTDMRKSTSRLLRSVFGRIDVFLTVDEKLRSSFNGYQTSFRDDLSFVRLPCDDTQVKGAIYMHSTFRSILNEILLSIQSDEWLRRDRTNVTLRYLFNLIAEDHPTIRLMGFDTMLRTIDRELSDGTAQEVPPLPITQALHDMSVVAACMQETSKYYNLISNINDQYVRLDNNATWEWRERERPWLSLVQNLLEKVLSRGNELNKAARNENIPLEQRHRQFWNSIDDCMLSWRDSNHIVRMILDQAPVPRAFAPQSSSNVAEARWDPQDTGSTPTATKKQKSKSRKVKNSKGRNPSKASGLPLGASAWLSGTEPRSRPSVYITERKAIEYWKRIRDQQKGQERFDLWKDFLTRIGFAMSSGMGSIFSFKLKGPGGESHTINFHDLHGWNGNKLPYELARNRWAKRLERHFNVIVSEDGAMD